LSHFPDTRRGRPRPRLLHQPEGLSPPKMRLAVVVQLTGNLVRMFAATLVAPALVAGYYRAWHDTYGFLTAAPGFWLLGLAMRRAGGTAAVGEAATLRRIAGLALAAVTSR